MQAVIAAHPDSIDLVDGALIGCVAEVGTALDVAARLAMLEAAVGYLNEAGYKHVFKGRFDLGTSGTQELACDRIGLGSGAISHTGDGVALSASGTREWQADLDARRLPVSCGKSLTREDRERADLLRRLLRGKKVRADRLANCPAVGRHALEKLRDLEECDLLRAAEDRVTATSRGRYLWRILARCLDPDPQLGGHIVSHDGHNSEERSRGDPAPERRRG
jgi:coproporphyrinogen III oxidase-like Fe-S oxidoreductase